MIKMSAPRIAEQTLAGCIALFAAAWLTLSLPGCQQSNGLTEVSGVVTFQGKPLTSGFVSFVPAGETGSGAAGTIGSDGRYELYNSRTVKGIAPGEYRIRIESWEVPPAMGSKAPKHAMPEKYYLVNTSPLRATIEAGRPQTVDLLLEE